MRQLQSSQDSPTPSFHRQIPRIGESSMAPRSFPPRQGLGSGSRLGATLQTRPPRLPSGSGPGAAARPVPPLSARRSPPLPSRPSHPSYPRRSLRQLLPVPLLLLIAFEVQLPGARASRLARAPASRQARADRLVTLPHGRAPRRLLAEATPAGRGQQQPQQHEPQRDRHRQGEPGGQRLRVEAQFEAQLRTQQPQPARQGVPHPGRRLLSPPGRHLLPASCSHRGPRPRRGPNRAGRRGRAQAERIAASGEPRRPGGTGGGGRGRAGRDRTGRERSLRGTRLPQPRGRLGLLLFLLPALRLARDVTAPSRARRSAPPQPPEPSAPSAPRGAGAAPPPPPPPSPPSPWSARPSPAQPRAVPAGKAAISTWQAAKGAGAAEAEGLESEVIKSNLWPNTTLSTRPWH